MISINNLKLSKTNKQLFRSKPYKNLNRLIVAIYILFILIYLFRESLYKLNNEYITLFAGTTPNLIPSFLFTLTGIFYAVPYFKGIDSINKPIFIWLINVFNIIFFSLIEYIHVVFKLGTWDNNDIIASIIGIVFSTVIYFNSRKKFIEEGI